MPESPAPSETLRQQEVFAFLGDPTTHGGEPVVRIDTHCAAVFLAGNRALKVKRAVRFPFLDQSTLERRKRGCQQEIDVNRRFAPQIYRRVVPITRTADGLRIGGNGEPVEWAVEMARFDERRTIDRLASTGPLAPGLAEAIADAIAASHRAAPLAAAAPWIASIEPIIADNTAAFTAGGFPGGEVSALADASSAAFAKIVGLLAKRGAQGFVRHCHGDLHLANIVLIDGEPVLFDAIEFDPAYASIDVLYDLAFPLMDLLALGRDDVAASVFNRYLAVTPSDNAEALTTLPLLLSMRAAIRAKVMLARPAADDDGVRANRRRAEAYFGLARRLIAPPPPRLIAVGGLSGTGKSVLARALAGDVRPAPGAVVLRSDVARKRLFGVAETERLPAQAYSAEVTAEVYRGVCAQAARILAQGHSAIVDAVFSKPEERDAIEAVAAERQITFEGLFLSADLETRIARVRSRVADASDATPEVVRQQQTYRHDRIGWTEIDAGGTPQQTLARARAALRIGDQVCST